MDYHCYFREAVQWKLHVVKMYRSMDQSTVSYAALEPGAALFNTASPADLSPSTCF